MFPSPTQVQVAAYRRWELRGRDHGRDLEDWFVAQSSLIVAMNYGIQSFFRLDGEPKQFTPSVEAPRRRCRYCGLNAPSTTFRTEAHAIPEFVGNRSLISLDECDACNAHFSVGIEDHLAKMTLPLRLNLVVAGKRGVPSYKATDEKIRVDYEDSARTFTIVDRLPEPMFQHDEESNEISAAFRCQPYIPIAAYKCFVKMALAIMNPEELKHYPQALAWIMTTDHAKHIEHFKGFGCYYHFLPFRYPVPWVTLLRREHADVKLPYMLLLPGTAQVVFQVHLPLCERDDHLIGESVVIPRAAAFAVPVQFGEGLANSIRLGSSDVARDTIFDVTIKYDSFAVTDK